MGQEYRQAARKPEGGRNLTFRVLDALGHAIVTGHYDGERFPTEDQLTASYNVSRTVMREAIKMLTAKGLLHPRPRAGTNVQPLFAWNLLDPDVLGWLLERKFSLDLLRHFTDLRRAIEPQAAALAATAGSGPARDAIVREFERMAAAVERGRSATLEADIAFHIAIMEAAANPFFLQFREMVATALRSSIQFTDRFADRVADIEAHRAVLTAIQANDPAAAAEAMIAIIDDVVSFIAAATVLNSSDFLSG